MVFNYTDNQLNNLNQDFAIYSVNKEFSERNKKKFVTDNPNNKNETNTITTSDGQEFRVVATKSDIETGFDGLAVAPIVNGKPDYKNVAVIAAGTDPDSPVNKSMFVSRDVNSAIIAKKCIYHHNIRLQINLLKKLWMIPDMKLVNYLAIPKGLIC